MIHGNSDRKELEDFKVQAYHNGQFKEVTRDSVLGKMEHLFFYPADFTFVCPTELGDMADHYDEFQAERRNLLGLCRFPLRA